MTQSFRVGPGTVHVELDKLNGTLEDVLQLRGFGALAPCIAP